MYIRAIGTVNHVFVTGSYTQLNFQKNEVVSEKSPFFVIVPFCTSHSICINIGIWQVSFVWKCYAFIRSTLN